MAWTDRVGEQREVGIVVERHPIASPWATHRWYAGAVLLDVPDTAPWTKLGEEAGVARYYAGSAPITLVPSECESYVYNLTGPAPQIWIVLKPAAPAPDGRDVELEAVTVAAGEADMLAGGSELTVEAIAMPREIADWVADFVERHPAPQTQFKRERSHHVSEGAALAEAMAKKRRNE